MTLLFAYGANMASAEMTDFCPEARFVAAARLSGHRLELRRRSRRWGGGAADIVAAPGAEVWGALYEVPEELLAGLDRKEGAGHAYRRRAVEVAVGDRQFTAQAYEVIDKEPEPVPCTPSYRARVLAGARERRLPGGYLRELEDRLS